MIPRVRKKNIFNLALIQLFLSATLLLVLGVLLRTPQYKALFARYDKSAADLSAPPAVIGKARVTIDFAGKKRAFEGPIIKDETAALALRQAALAGGIKLSWKETDGIARLTGIDKFFNGEKNWAAYINGKRLSVSLSETKINSNDEILLVYR